MRWLYIKQTFIEQKSIVILFIRECLVISKRELTVVFWGRIFIVVRRTNRLYVNIMRILSTKLFPFHTLIKAIIPQYGQINFMVLTQQSESMTLLYVINIFTNLVFLFLLIGHFLYEVIVNLHNFWGLSVIWLLIRYVLLKLLRLQVFINFCLNIAITTFLQIVFRRQPLLFFVDWAVGWYRICTIFVHSELLHLSCLFLR